MVDQNDNYLKTVVDIFSKQYDQFQTSVQRWQDSNDKAHDQLFKKIDSITNDVHDISSSVKVIINNQEAHQREVENLKKTVADLTSRLEALEEDQGKKKHFWGQWKHGITITGTIVAVALGIWKLLEFLGFL